MQLLLRELVLDTGILGQGVQLCDEPCDGCFGPEGSAYECECGGRLLIARLGRVGEVGAVHFAVDGVDSPSDLRDVVAVELREACCEHGRCLGVEGQE